MLLFFSTYLLLIALVIFVVAGRTALRLHTILTTWPRADAEVIYCREIHGPNIRGRTPSSTECQLRYSVAGHPYTALTRTPFSFPESSAAPAWLAQHPPGSHITLYYAPGAPDSGPVSLGGADAAIDSEEPGHFFRIAAVVALIGFALLGTAFFRFRRIARPR